MEAYATVRAPLSGRVIDKKVNAGDTVSPGQMLVTMYDPSHMQMVACVRESLALRLKIGEQVPARLDTLGYDCHSTVSEIVPEAQAESRSFHVKVTVPCPPNVYSGMFGRILIPLEDEDLLIVPAAAVRGSDSSTRSTSSQTRSSVAGRCSSGGRSTKASRSSPGSPRARKSCSRRVRRNDRWEASDERGGVPKPDRTASRRNVTIFLTGSSMFSSTTTSRSS